MVLKRLAVSFAVILPLSAALLAGAAAAVQSSGNEPPMTDSMPCNLWSGASLDLSGGTCAALSASSNSVPSPSSIPTTQSIICNLIAGANFDLSGDGCNALSANSPGSYAALGDSVAAGLGLPSHDALCGRSDEAYPSIVDNVLKQPFLHLACSGATVSDVSASQLDAAFAAGTPQTMSITIGANDIGWSQLLQACFITDCATAANTSIVNSRLATLQNSLNALFSSIESRSQGSPPAVVITGYYDPVSVACSTMQTRLTPDEIAWIAAGVQALNQTIAQSAASFPFVRFAPVDFTGHDVCSGSSWVQSLNDTAPLHPTAAGQQAIADDVLQALGN